MIVNLPNLYVKIKFSYATNNFPIKFMQVSSIELMSSLSTDNFATCHCLQQYLEHNVQLASVMLYCSAVLGGNCVVMLVAVCLQQISYPRKRLTLMII